MIAGGSAARQMDTLALTFYTQAFCIPIVFSALISFGTIKFPVDPVGWLGLHGYGRLHIRNAFDDGRRFTSRSSLHD